MQNTVYTKPLSKERWADFEAYFEFDGSCSGCWCMNHRLPMGLDFDGEAAKLAMQQLVQSERVFGVLAYIEGDDTPIGWAALDRKKTLPGHDLIAEAIQCSQHEWSIHCLTTRKDYKNQGIETLLARAATDLAMTLGAQRIEAYPEPYSHPNQVFTTWNTFSGHQDSFADLGYTVCSTKDTTHAEFFQLMEKVGF